MLFTWVEELFSSLVYKKWTSVVYSIEKNNNNWLQSTLQTLILYKIFPKNV
jgi:hypothetical protein